MVLRLGCCLTAAALLVTGCGGGKKGPAGNGVVDMTPAQALTAAQQAVASATSVHVVGSFSSEGSPVTLDLKLVAGKGGAGHVRLGTLTFDIVRIGPKAYFRGGAPFWRHFGGAKAVQLLSGRWISASALEGQLAAFTPLTDLGKLTAEILSSPGELEMGDTTTVDHQPAIAIVQKTGGGTLYVATTGPAYPLELTGPESGEKSSISFTDWDQPVLLSPPAGAVAYSKVSGG